MISRRKYLSTTALLAGGAALLDRLGLGDRVSADTNEADPHAGQASAAAEI
jgi:hypothetical protein